MPKAKLVAKYSRMSPLLLAALLFMHVFLASSVQAARDSSSSSSSRTGSSAQMEAVAGTVAGITSQQDQETLKSVRMLVPYEDLSKVLAERVGKYVILPDQEYQQMVMEKEAWLASCSAKTIAPPPLETRFVSTHAEGRIDGDFARMDVEFVIESLVETWQTIDLLRGALVIASATLDDEPVALDPRLDQAAPRALQFGRRAKNAALSGISAGPNTDLLRQENWSDLRFQLTFKGAGRHRCRVSFLLPVERLEERFSLVMSFARVPLSFIKLEIPDHVIALESCSLRDYTIEEIGENGCSFFGWLGAGGEYRMAWRKKVRRKTDSMPAVIPETPLVTASGTSSATSAVKITAPLQKPAPLKVPIKPLIYARTETLITLGEGALQGHVDIEYAITKAPVSRFEIMLPDTVELLNVSADRPETHEVRREGVQKRLIVDFTASREDKSQISLAFEAKMDDTQGEYRLPEVFPVGIAREMGSLAVQALTSVEVQPAEDTDASGAGRLFRVDVNEIPETLARRSARPILLAYKHTARPLNLPIIVKRYDDLPQQTVAADIMDAKTTFTTNRSSNTQISLRIRNNNKQYVTFQLATEAEVLGAFINNKPVKPVTDKSGGKVLVPLSMSKVFGRPEEMELRLMYKQEVATMGWRGDLDFTVPILDIPVSRFTWTLFAPTQYYLYQFAGTVQSAKAPRDPFFFRGFLACYDIFVEALKEPGTIFLLFLFVGGLLLILSREVLFMILNGIWSVVVTVFRFVFNGAMFRLAEIFIVLCIISILAAISIPNFRKAREQARDKACYANQRVLLGAIEMYNMDHTPPMTGLGPNTESELRAGGFLKSHLTKPESNCEYLTRGDLTAGGQIYCRRHGAIEDQYDEVRRDSGSTSPSSVSSIFGKITDKLGAVSRKGGDKQQASSQEEQKSAMPIRGGRAKGVEPIENRLVLTTNFYGLERDLVLADLATDGRLLANRTCPELHVSYLRNEVFKGLKILAFFLGLLAGIYFIAGASFGYLPKCAVAGLILLVLSGADLSLEEIGDYANTGLWLALLCGVFWKIGLLVAHSIQSATRPPSASGPGIVGLLIGLSLLASSPAFSQPTGREIQGSAGIEREIRVMVPFKELSQIVQPNEKVVILPVEDYRYLLELGIARPAEPERAPMDFIIRSARYRGHVEERGLRFSVLFQIELMNPGWKFIRLLSVEAVPSKALLDGQPIALDLFDGGSIPDITGTNSNSKGAVDAFKAANPNAYVAPGANQMAGGAGYGLITQATGTKQLEATFFIPFQAKDPAIRRFELPMLPLCMSSLEVEVPESDAEGWIDPGVLSIRSAGATGTTFVALLPPTSRIHFEWFRRVVRPVGDLVAESEGVVHETVGSMTETTPASAAISVPARIEVIREETRVILRESGLLSFEEGFLRGRHRYQMEVTGGDGIASFSFLLPGEVTVLKVEGRAVEDWLVEEPSANQQLRRLQISFNSRIKGRSEMTVEFEQDILDREEAVVTVPELLPMNVDRVVGTLGIGCLSVLDIAVNAPPEGYNPIDVAEFLREYGGATSDKTPFAFKFIRHPNKLVLNVNRPRDVDVQASIIDKVEAVTVLNDDGYLLTRVAYEIRNKSEQFLKLRLPVVDEKPAELWSSEAAGQPVKAGFDRQNAMYNIPIIRSPVENGEVMPFPVEIVFANRLAGPVQPMMHLPLAMPWVHLTQSELSWVVYLPEGYELMRGQGNVDFNMNLTKPTQGLLDGSRVFAVKSDFLADAKSQATYGNVRQSGVQGIGQSGTNVQGGQAGNIGGDRLFGILGLLPVKFSLPITSYWTAFSMLQIEPKGAVPHIQGMLVTPRKGIGRFLSWGMMLLGAIAGLAVICLVTGRRPMLSFFVTCILSSILATALLMKLYQADTSFKMGFLVIVIGGMLYRIYQWNPPGTSVSASSSSPSSPKMKG
ncbi:MAG: hypothetical protein WA705_29360 [Candidatus Ozemobacteraceae bacterium]